MENENLEIERARIWASADELEYLQQTTFGEAAVLQLLHNYTKEERLSVGVFAVHTADNLRRLQRYSVLNDAFHIWYDGQFGTINGLRLGRLPSKPVSIVFICTYTLTLFSLALNIFKVEWVEINAALGQAVLLLQTIAERTGTKFTRNKLLHRGSFSRVSNMYLKEYPLFSDGSIFRRRSFSHGLTLFLECVDDAGKRAMREDASVKFPYKITRGKIGELSISLGNDEQWTRALKYMLTHLKYILAWSAKKYP